MTDLQTLSRLQARLYEFLAEHDDATLRQLASGRLRLALVPPGERPEADALGDKLGDVRSFATPGLRPSDPTQVARELSDIPTAHERRFYLNASGVTLKTLQKVAKGFGLKGYSRLPSAGLKELLAEQKVNHVPDVPETASPGSSDRAAGLTALPSRGDEAPPPDSGPAREPSSESPVGRAIDAGAIAARLRELDTEVDGAEYLRSLQLDWDGLRTVAKALMLSRVDHLTPSELEKRILKQAIGARNKFTGLRT